MSFSKCGWEKKSLWLHSKTGRKQFISYLFNGTAESQIQLYQHSKVSNLVFGILKTGLLLVNTESPQVFTNNKHAFLYCQKTKIQLCVICTTEITNITVLQHFSRPGTGTCCPKVVWVERKCPNSLNPPVAPQLIKLRMGEIACLHA